MSEEGKVKVSSEIAEQELKKFAESLDVDLDDESNTQHKKRLIRAIVDGLLHFEDDERGKTRAVQITEESKTRIVYGAVTAEAKAQIHKHGSTSEGIYGFLGNITKLGPDVMKQLEDRDGKIMDAIAVFLVS